MSENVEGRHNPEHPPPHGRTFAPTRNTDDPKIIRGIVDRKTERPKDRKTEDIPSFQSQWENKLATLHLRTISVPTTIRYILTGASSR